MIDRTARNKTADLLKKFASGHITNDELADNIPKSQDPVIKAVDDFAWTLYSDEREHYAKERHKLSKSEKKNIARCILFLKSENEYSYPDNKNHPFRSFFYILNLLSFGLIKDTTPRNSKTEEHGDLSVWPFVSRKQLNKTAQLLK